MIREDKKIRRALRSAPIPEPPQELLETILSQNNLKRSKPVVLRWAFAACAAVSVFCVWWTVADRRPSTGADCLVVKKQVDPPTTSAIQKPVPNKHDEQSRTAPKKAPRILTGREPAVRIRKESPRTYLASQSDEALASRQPYISPVKVGRHDPRSGGSATISSWAQNERGVWVLTEVKEKIVGGKQITEITKTESDRPEQKLLVTNDLQDEPSSGGKDE